LNYGEDLSYIHDAGYSGYVLRAAPGILSILKKNGVVGGLAIDLGCGSGRLARELLAAGYEVLGVDQSRAMIALARRTAPEASFVVSSVYKAKLPPCDAVVSTGECLNYAFDSAARGLGALGKFFHRVHASLRPGGVFFFDLATTSRLAAASGRVEKDWAVFVKPERARNVLTRRITIFRKQGRVYRRIHEIHRVRLYGPDQILTALSAAGFEASRTNRLGRFKLPPGVAGFLAIAKGA
jgi:SAM-dependent methyltransferase